MKLRTLAIVLSVVGAALVGAAAQGQLPDEASGKRIVVEERAKYPTPMKAAQIVAMLKAIAARMNAEGLAGGPFGVLVKLGGAHCNGYACDIICTGNGSAQKQWDVLGNGDPAESDTPGTQEPNFGAPLDTIAVRPCELQGQAPPVIVDAPLKARVAELEALVAAKNARISELDKVAADRYFENQDLRAAAESAKARAEGLEADKRDLESRLAEAEKPARCRGFLKALGIRIPASCEVYKD